MSSSIRSILAVVFVASGILLAGSGCVKIDATVTVERDGSGSLRAIYGMPTYIIKQAELARQITRSLDLAAGITNAIPQELDIPYLYDETLLKAKFAAMAKEGVSVDSIKTRAQGGWNYVDFTLRFTSLELLCRQPFLNDVGVVFKHLDEKACKMTISLPQVGTTPEAASAVTQESLNKLTPFFNGLRVVTRLSLPGEIRNNNALMSDNRRATWEWDFDKDPQVLARLARDKMIVVFEASEVRIKDFEKPAEFVPLNEK